MLFTLWSNGEYESNRTTRSKEMYSRPGYIKKQRLIALKRWQDSNWVKRREEFYKDYIHPQGIEVTIGNDSFLSYSEAEDKTGISRRTISDRCNSNEPLYRFYVSDGETHDQKFRRLDWGRTIVVNDVIYFCIKEVSIKYNISHPTVRRRILSVTSKFKEWYDKDSYVKEFGLDRFKELLDTQYPKETIYE